MGLAAVITHGALGDDELVQRRRVHTVMNTYSE